MKIGNWLLFLILSGLIITASEAADVQMSWDVSVDGSITATSFSGIGSGLSQLDPTKLSSGTAAINISGNASTATSATTAGSVSSGAVTTAGISAGAVTPAKIAFYGNVAIVAPSGGDYDDPALAMSNYQEWCRPPGDDTAPCLLKIMPGTYNVGATAVQMRPYIDIEGSGEGITKIVSALSSTDDPPTVGAVIGANNSELRFITVENTGTGSHSVGVLNTSASPRLTNITAIASGGSSTRTGIYNLTSSPTMTNVTAAAKGGIGVGSCISKGIHNRDSSSPMMAHVAASAEGANSSSGSIGIQNQFNSKPAIIDSSATASGGDYSIGVSNDSAASLRNVVVKASNGITSNYGISNTGGDLAIIGSVVSGIGGGNSNGIRNWSASLDMINVVVDGTGGTNSYGIYNETSAGGYVRINHSIIKGQTNTIYNTVGFITTVGNTQLNGAIAYKQASSTLTCFGVYNGSYLSLNATCQ